MIMFDPTDPTTATALDVDRHRPLLDMGVPMDVDGHSVGAFLGRIAKIEQGVLLVDQLDRMNDISNADLLDVSSPSPPPSPSPSFVTKYSTIKSLRRHTESNTMSPVAQNIEAHINPNDKHAFETFVKQTQLESRYYLKKDELLQENESDDDERPMRFGHPATIVVLENADQDLDLVDDEKLGFQLETFGHRK
jgi:hypothetical protein